MIAVAIAANVAPVIQGLDPLDRLELDMVLAAVAAADMVALAAASEPHRSRDNQSVLRAGRLLVSFQASRAREAMTVRHVKVLSRSAKA